MGWTNRDATHLGVDRIGTSPTVFALYENPIAIANGDAGAPQIQTAALANLSATEAKIAAAAISQSKLKTANGEVSQNSPTDALFTLPGGAYGFYPQIYSSSVGASIQSYTIGGQGLFEGTAVGTTLLTRIHLKGQSGSNARAQQRYIQASPPYDLGDGEVPLFVFALVDSSGEILATYSAEDPPWANNGPTDIRPDGHLANGTPVKVVRPRLALAALRDPRARAAELAKLERFPKLIEVTQALKQADMPLIPHPFTGNDLAGKTVVLLDPVSDLVHRLHELHLSGESLGEVLHGDYLRLDNQALARSAPPAVMPVAVSWK